MAANSKSGDDDRKIALAYEQNQFECSQCGKKSTVGAEAYQHKGIVRVRVMSLMDSAREKIRNDTDGSVFHFNNGEGRARLQLRRPSKFKTRGNGLTIPFFKWQIVLRRKPVFHPIRLVWPDSDNMPEGGYETFTKGTG